MLKYWADFFLINNSGTHIDLYPSTEMLFKVYSHLLLFPAIAERKFSFYPKCCKSKHHKHMVVFSRKHSMHKLFTKTELCMIAENHRCVSIWTEITDIVVWEGITEVPSGCLSWMKPRRRNPIYEWIKMLRDILKYDEMRNSTRLPLELFLTIGVDD